MKRKLPLSRIAPSAKQIDLIIILIYTFSFR